MDLKEEVRQMMREIVKEFMCELNPFCSSLEGAIDRLSNEIGRIRDAVNYQNSASNEILLQINTTLQRTINQQEEREQKELPVLKNQVEALKMGVQYLHGKLEERSSLWGETAEEVTG